ncbi:MAG: FAD-dependent oxidoreductase, partial [Firmicutes bacterium]|nr:FAD-dependent oxidoreductase [Bacillota bacterium]
GPDRWDRNYRDTNKINCYDTGTSPCKTACPAHIAVQGYIRMAAEGRYEEAIRLIRQDNPFPAVCGAVCNRRCEDRCTRGTIDKPVAIDEIKKFLAQWELMNPQDYVPICDNMDGKQWDGFPIAVIGAGPAGLSAAYYLRKEGYPVTVFDREKRPGGMMMNGIPNFRLEKKVIQGEIDIIEKMGVEIRCGVEIGKDITIQQLREQGYKAFYLATGLQSGGRMGIPGEDAQGVRAGIEFAREINQDESIRIAGKTVVIGGGNIAADIARTALRAGAESVDLYCLESYDDMPMGPDDRRECEEEGIRIHAGWGQTEIVAEDGKCKAIRFRKCLSVKNAEGRFDPQFDDAVTETAACENVLYCIGQKPDWGKLLEGTHVEFNKNGTVKADPVTYQTGEPDIFVGGDAYTGQKFVIDAIAAGRQGAVSINRFVHPGQSLTIGRDLREFIELDRDDIRVESYDNAQRQMPGLKPGEAAATFDDLRLPLTEEQVRIEAGRCLKCGATTVDLNQCVGCGLCTTRCEFDAIHLSRDLPAASDMHTAEEMMKVVGPYALKRGFKILKRKVTGKSDYPTWQE